MLSIWTDRSEQTVQTQIIMLLSKVYAAILFLLDALLYGKTTINFQTIAALIWSVPILVYLRYMWATTWQNQQSECAPSEDSDQPGHPPSLIRVFAVRMKKPWVLSYPLSAQRRLWSDWADLSLHPVWSESSLAYTLLVLSGRGSCVNNTLLLQQIPRKSNQNYCNRGTLILTV